MEQPLTGGTDIDSVRRCIARAVLGAPARVAPALGRVVLRDHQLVAASRVLELLREHAGALLADPVGLGKTYVALAVARHFARAIVVAPASLRRMWSAAAAAANVPITTVSHEGLSRGDPCRAAEADQSSLVIIDEAHRFRNPNTQRYSRALELCREASTLLVSATPIQNRVKDLAAPLALFLGSQAFSLEPQDLARYVVRGADGSADARLPALIGPTRIPVAVDCSILSRIQRLPAPVPASDEGLAAALMSEMLTRRWLSSQAALVESLRRLAARAGGLRDAALAGRRLTRADVQLWNHAEDSVQLAFPELLGHAATAPAVDGPSLIRALDRYLKASDTLLRDMRRVPNPDEARAEALDALRRRHADERIIAFSQYASTVQSLFQRTASTAGVAALSASGARIASGRIPREQVIEQFEPGLRAAASAAARIELLLATDLLSEGLNLQEASVVVHLDLPWNPARLDQRVGRVRRIGSARAAVSVYMMDPAGGIRAMERIEARLRAKLRLAMTTVGGSGRVLPVSDDPTRHVRAPATAEALSGVYATLRSWLRPASHVSPPARPELHGCPRAAVPAAAVQSREAGWLCACGDDTRVRLVASLHGRISTDADHLRAALLIASGRQSARDEARTATCLAAASAWVDEQRASRAVDLRMALTSRARRRLLSRIALSVAAAPRHRRAILAPIAQDARRAATMQLSAGAERVLHGLVARELAPEPWLRSIAAFASENVRDGAKQPAGESADRVLALIAFDALEPE